MATVSQGDFPFCCGVKVLGHGEFGLGDDADCLSQAIRDRVDPANNGCLLYTTIANQKREYNALKMAGFNILGKFKNPRTGRWVFLWGWLRAPLPSRTRTVRGPRMVGGLPARVATRRRSSSRRRTTTRR